MPIDASPSTQPARSRLAQVNTLIKGNSITALAFRGSIWIVAGYGTMQALRLASNLILTRLLVPDDFAVMAIVTAVMQGLMMFSDVGVGPSIIQNKREDRDFLDSAWTFQLIRGSALWLVCSVLAWPIAVGYGEPALAALLPVAGLAALAQGFATTAVHTANRDLRIGRLTLIHLLGQVIATATMIVWAVIEPTVWALAAGGVAGAIATVLLGYALLPAHRPRLRWETDAVRSLFRFGRWIFLSTIVTFLAKQADQLIFPFLFGLSDLAYYAIATVLVMTVLTVVNKIAGQIMFPAYARVVRDHDHDALVKTTRRFALAVAPAYLLPVTMILFGEALIGLLYDPRWSATGGMLVLLAAAVHIDMVRASQNGVLLAVGNSRGTMIINTIRLVAWLPTAIGLGLAYGPLGFCAAQCVGAGAALITQRRMTSGVLGDSPGRLDEIFLLVLLAAVGIKTLRVTGVLP
ncbi:MAG: oligosaccharide flippase family protein [Planctomycetota bacterium]